MLELQARSHTKDRHSSHYRHRHHIPEHHHERAAVRTQHAQHRRELGPSEDEHGPFRSEAGLSGEEDQRRPGSELQQRDHKRDRHSAHGASHPHYRNAAGSPWLPHQQEWAPISFVDETKREEDERRVLRTAAEERQLASADAAMEAAQLEAAREAADFRHASSAEMSGEQLADEADDLGVGGGVYAQVDEDDADAEETSTTAAEETSATAAGGKTADDQNEPLSLDLQEAATGQEIDADSEATQDRELTANAEKIAAERAIAEDGADDSDGEHGGKAKDHHKGGGHHKGESHAGRELAMLNRISRAEGHAIAGLLILFVIVDMGLLNYLNHSDKQVQSYCYKTVSACLSIFCAVLLEKAQHDMLHRYIPHGYTFYVKIGLFLLWHQMISILCFKYRRIAGYASQGIIKHLAAFTLLNVFENVEEMYGSFYQSNHKLQLLTYIGFPILCIAVHYITAALGYSCRTWCLATWPPTGDTSTETESESGDSVSDAGEAGEAHAGHGGPHWVHLAMEGEEDCSAIVVGFLLRQLLTFVLIGEVPQGMSAPHILKIFSMWSVYIADVCLVLLMLLSAYVVEQCHRGGTPYKVACYVHMCISFTLAFCLVGALKCTAKYYGIHAGGMRLAVAAIATPMTIGAIVLIDKLADMRRMSEKSAEALINAGGLVAGLAWEKAFAHSIDVIAHENAHVQGMELVPVETLLCLALIMLILPGWKVFILPKASRPTPRREDDLKKEPELPTPMVEAEADDNRPSTDPIDTSVPVEVQRTSTQVAEGATVAADASPGVAAAENQGPPAVPQQEVAAN